MPTPVSTDLAARVAAAWARVRDAARAARAVAHGRPREGGAPRSDRVSARRDREGGAQSGRGRDACAPRGRCWPAPSGSSALRGELRGALRERRRRPRRRSAASGSGSASWRRSTRSSPPYVDARDGIKSQLEDLAFFLRSYADGVDASPGRLQEVEDRLALLERLKRKYGPTLQDVIDRGRSLRRGARAADRRRRARRRSAEGAGRSRRARYLDVARELSTQAARARRARSRAASKALLAELAMARTRFEVRFNAGRAGPGGVERAGHRSRRVLRLAEPRRGAAAARADRLGRRAVARHAGAEDADRRRTRRGRR